MSDARLALPAAVIGLVLLGWAWWDASGTGKLDDQVRSVVFALIGAGAVAAGSVAWLAAGRRALRVRRLALINRLDESVLPLPVQEEAVEPESDGFVAVKGTALYHRADCLLVRGKSVQAVRSVAKRAACPMCRP